jgi:hypothetical protein
MDSVSNVEEPASSWDELYNFNFIPSELFVKFRKELQGVRVALNMEVFLFSTFYYFHILIIIIIILHTLCCMSHLIHSHTNCN